MTEFLQWCQNSGLSQLIRSAKWPYPTIEIAHIAGLVMVFGSVLVTNLRIFGRVLKSTPVFEVARGVAPITLVGLTVQVISGPMLFIATPQRFYDSEPFRLKLLLLTIALVYHFWIHRPLATSQIANLNKLKLSATLSMVLWLGVVLTGFAIELLAG